MSAARTHSHQFPGSEFSGSQFLPAAFLMKFCRRVIQLRAVAGDFAHEPHRTVTTSNRTITSASRKPATPKEHKCNCIVGEFGITLSTEFASNCIFGYGKQRPPFHSRYKRIYPVCNGDGDRTQSPHYPGAA